MLIQRHLHVRGLVQGVYYRDTCRQLAEESGVTGWVRNLHNGDVEALFEGSPENVTRLVHWAAKGPGAAEVTKCAVTAESPEGHRDFRILPDARPA
ncbi:acylphosphatase [Streptomyces rimosus subsp. pseudoverticillatus]|uniref:acylphosphatase n=1 Tax=Streptomyces rimosus TaxID=1927 RepID=UPI0006B26A2A|nr:acylphosphatase [Streptomyces rimosus]KOT81869.1 acylphosphatase [Streptomyces rimosus subsp. pseudoverticillatus]